MVYPPTTHHISHPPQYKPVAMVIKTDALLLSHTSTVITIRQTVNGGLATCVQFWGVE